jgi:hypothetical protein
MKTDQDAIFDSDVALFALVRLPAWDLRMQLNIMESI